MIKQKRLNPHDLFNVEYLQTYDLLLPDYLFGDKNDVYTSTNDTAVSDIKHFVHSYERITQEYKPSSAFCVNVRMYNLKNGYYFREDYGRERPVADELILDLYTIRHRIITKIDVYNTENRLCMKFYQAPYVFVGILDLTKGDLEFWFDKRRGRLEIGVLNA